MKVFKRIKNNLPKVIFPAILILVVGILAFTNYVPGAWLTGWDNLQQELNFDINWSRHLDSAWQEYQGLGLAATMGHASDTVRLVIVKAMSFIISSHNLRYAYLFVCLAVGALGLYALLSWLATQLRERRRLNVSTTQIRLIAFVGALFFILNLGTLQNFYAPIEMFPTQWAFLPWLFLYIFKTLEQPKAKNFLIFAVISLLATPMAYTPTLFLVYALAVAAVFTLKLFTSILHPKELGSVFRRIFGLGIIILVVNSFWLIPFVYSFANNASSTVIDAKINQMSSEDSYALNQKYGTPANLALLKGFWFDNIDYKIQDKEFGYMFDEWRSYQDIPAIPAIGYLMFGIVLIGVLYSYIAGLPYRYSLTLMLIIGCIIFLNSNPPFGQMFDELRNAIPAFKEALRFPFTKISPLLTMLYAVFFGLGTLAILQLTKKISGLQIGLPLTLILSIMLVIFSFPMFAGHLVYKELQVKIPDSYFEMFNWFNQQPESLRIADLPQANFWGWNFYDWGYRGSGFMWYGVKQPVLDRAFDVWSNKNEQYYNEVSNAIYTLNFDQLAQIAQKYRIGWFVYDSSINVVLNEEHQKFYREQFIPLLNKDKRFKLEQTFGDQLAVFSYLENTQNPEPITVVKPTQNISGSLIPNYQDAAYNEGEYVTTEDANTAYLIPNTNLNDRVQVDTQSITYTADLQLGGNLILKNYWEKEKYVPLAVSAKRESDRKLVVKLKYIVPEISQGSTSIYPTEDIVQEIDLPAANYYLGNQYGFVRIESNSTQFQDFGYLIVDHNQTINAYNIDEVQRLDLSPSFASVEAGHCSDTKSRLGSFVNKDTNGEVINLSARKAIGCLYVGVEPVFNNNYLLNLEFNYQSLTKALPSICVLQVNIDKCINRPLDPGIARDSDKFYSYSQLVEMTSKLNSAAGFQLMVDALNSDITHQINYRDIFVSYFPLTKQIKLDPTVLAKTTDVTINIGNTPLTVTYPVLSETSLSYIADLETAGKRTPLNCGATQTGNYTSSYDEVSGSLEFQATDADSCQVFTDLNLPRDASYLLTTTSTHVAGQQAKICLSNPLLQKCVQEYGLGHSNSESILNTIIPAQSGEVGYDIRISNLSRGGFPTINKLSGMRLQFYPVGFLSAIKLTNPTTNFDTTSTLKLSEIKRSAPFLYTVTVEGKGYLNLNQASNPGWKVIGTTADSVEVNGWAQGWYVDVETPTKITIIYWPQIFQYLGMFMVAALFIILILEVVLEHRFNLKQEYQEV